MSESVRGDVPASPNADQPMLVEVSWETCRQSGGIYTVIRSKAAVVVEKFAHDYLLLGPYDPARSPAEFDELPCQGVLCDVLKSLKARGIDARFGRWLVSGEPRVVLMDPRSVHARLGEIKYLLWEHHSISMPAGDALLDDVVTFGHCVEHFFRELTARTSAGKTVIGHFHEWMGGTAIPELRRTSLPMAIVFTTHATSLGRYLAMNDPWFYDHLPFVDWLADARRFNIEAQAKLERAAAHGAHVFTTVSDITGYECEFILGRKPDRLLPNGINIERFVAMHEFQNLHREYRDNINQFTMGHFFPSYTFDLDRTLYLFTSGRYEYRNKGFDLTLDSLAQLNHRMREQNIDKTIVFFVLAPRPFKSINAEALHSRAQMEEIRKTCREITDAVGDKFFNAVVMGQTPRLDELIDDYWRIRLRRMRYSWQISRLPTIVTHDIYDDTSDDVLNHLRRLGLINKPEDRVKVIYYPDFLTASSPLFGMDYDQFVRGCHLGVFPSYYEPWGYTPLECVARGVPAVTSDLSGFGTYLQRNMPDYEDRGLFVAHRRYESYNAAVDELADYLFRFVQLERRGRIALRNTVESNADRLDWRNLVTHYYDAYKLVTDWTK